MAQRGNALAALPWGLPSTWGKLAGLAAAYYLAAQVGLAFALSDAVASPVWPPAGLAIAAVALWGARAWPGVAAGVLLVETGVGVPLGWATVVAAGTSLEALVGGWLLRRAGGHLAFRSLRGIPWHAAAAFAAPVPAALAGVAALVGSGIIAAPAAPTVALTWYLGDVAGAVLVAPAILLAAHALPGRLPPWAARRAAEAVAAVTALALTALAVFVLGAPFAYLYVAPIIWIAMRFGPAFTAFALVALDAVAVLATRAGRGPFAADTANHSLLLLQGFVVGVNLLAFAVAALSSERARAAADLERRVAQRTQQLQGANDRLRHEAAQRALVQAQVDEAQRVASMGTWRWDLAKPHADWSPELYRIYGLDPDKHTPSYEDYLTRIHPDDVERVKAATQAVLQDGKPYSHDERIRRPDGSLRTLHTWAKAIVGPQGSIVALVGACQDVTEQKKSEAALQESLERFRALAESSPIGIVHTTPDGVVDYANRAWSAITGIADVRDAAAKVWLAVHPDDRERSQRLWGEARANATAFADETRWVRPDGTTRLTSCRAVPVRDGAGQVTGFVSTLEDITEQRAAEARDHEVQRLREQADFKTNFLRTAAHELGTPMTPILLQARMLRDMLAAKGLDREIHAMDIMARNIQRLRVLVQDLLDSARLQSARLGLAPRPMDLSSLVHEAVETFQGPAIEAGVSLDLDAPRELPIVADPDRLAQVLHNLLSNAMKFTSAGDQVHVRLRQPSPDVVQVIVQDTGRGFAPDRVAHLFQPFSQLHDMAQATRPGTGLGLYISRGIVEQHGGTMEAVSAGPGQGATFTCTLPINASPSPPEAATAAAAPRGTPHLTAG